MTTLLPSYPVRVRAAGLSTAALLAPLAATGAPADLMSGAVVGDGLLAKAAGLTFGLDQVSALQTTVFGNPLWQYLASFLFILLAFYVSKLLDYLVRVRLKRWAAGTANQLDDVIVQLVQGPVKVVAFVVLLHVGLNVFDWPDWAKRFLSVGLKLTVAVSITYVLISALDTLAEYWRKRVAAAEDKVFNEQLFPVLRKTVRVFVIVVAALVTAQNLGLNVTGLLASLSIGGLALGLAAQDTLANFFGAVAVFLDKPFHVGDRIKLEGCDGVVETIGLRSTRVRNLDGHLVTIPNKTMGSATITNISKRPTIKTTMNIGITYDTPTDRVRQALALLEEVYRAHPMTADVWISFNQFADSALNILVIHWWNSVDYKAYLAGMQELNLEVKRRFDAAGISFAFPTRTLYLKQDSELFVRQASASVPLPEWAHPAQSARKTESP